MKRQRTENKAERAPRCPICGRRIEAKTTVRDRSNAVHQLRAKPGELTQCQCGSVLEYSGSSGELTLKRASAERVRAFRELERERPSHMELPAVVKYVWKFRTMPSQTADQTSGRIRLT